ncbi:SDR family oxidoreductase [Myxococcota bacterium]|nr:SDR family oxidoreductase [Myxococcota bacterium]
MVGSQGSQDLSGRVALITGAASGIGRAAALRFAEAGAAVMCADIDADGAALSAEQVTAAGGRAASLALDVTDEIAVEKSLQQTIDTLGGFDVLFNNAGVGGTVRGVSDFAGTLDVNLNGVYYGLRYGAELLATRGGGAVVNTASIAGLVGLVAPLPMEQRMQEGGGIAYMASKHAVVGLTRQFAVSYAKHGVRVNAVAPGYIDTPMTHMIRDGAVVQEGFEALHPMGRLGRAEEVADAAVYLSSDRASFVTGVVLPVDGGYTAR